jgi:diguanylate cyclase (GGDEF)-like protein/PAS domain S-box-containing protein
VETRDQIFYDLLEDARDAVIIVDRRSGGVRFWNPAARALLGYAAAEAASPAPDRLLSGILDVAGGATGAVELAVFTGEGREVWVELTASPLADAQLTLLVLRDATGRKRAEAELRAGERRYKELVERAGDVIYTIAPDGRFTFVNTTAVHAMGYPERELVGKHYLDLVRPDHHERLAEHYRRQFLERVPTTYLEFPAIAADGRELWIGQNVQLRIEGGRVIEAQAVARDITDQRRVAAALRESEERFRSAFAHAAIGMALVTREGRWLQVNRALCDFLGYAEAELLATDLEAVGHPEDRETERIQTERLFAGEIPSYELEKRFLHAQGHAVWALVSGSAVRDSEDGPLNLILQLQDITERKRGEARIHQLAHYDPLTELPNRALFRDRLEQAIARARRNQQQIGLLFLDLDRFKAINDSLGHDFGDQLLAAAARRLTSSLRGSDTIARMGGDEFTVLIGDVVHAQDAGAVAQKVLGVLARPFQLEDQEVFTSASIGVAVYPADGEDAEDLIKNADSAMYQAKAAGKNAFRFYAADMNARARTRLELESSLRRALEREELRLHFQPQVDLASRRIAGLEALVRWERPGRGLISPAEFIPLAEETGQIVPIGDWVLRAACAQAVAWQAAGLPPLPVTVNLSARQFRQPDLVKTVLVALRDTALDPRFLTLELTESAIMLDAEASIETLRRLKEAVSISLSIDDFGTGYSSLSYLKRFPLNILKIDKSFVQDVTVSPDDAAIAAATIALAHSLNLKVVAEGVETEEQLAFLREHGCDGFQGYVFSRPLPAADIEPLLRDHTR